MMKKSKYFLLLIAPLFSSSITIAQQKAPLTEDDYKGWHLKDKKQTGFYGISIDSAYSLLSNRKSKTVVVAVIDSGIDTVHEDLKPVLWVNPKEKAGNGIDDDANGYVDDVYGWNFCGAKDGNNIDRNSWEIARVYHIWKNEFEGKKEKKINEDKKFLYQQWKKSKTILEDSYKKAKDKIEDVRYTIGKFEEASVLIKSTYKISKFTLKELELMKPERISKELEIAVVNWKRIFDNDKIVTDSIVLDDSKKYIDRLQNDINRYETAPDDNRGKYTKDNYTDINDKYYGNNNLKSGSGNHGTLVAGTIAAIRDNKIGSVGICDNVQIMAVRAVPGGDEHDKDVALAIRYAVDNGASIINMSFGKPVSPYKQFVDDAVKYAAEKGVLLVHGAGNDGKNIDEDVFYPNPVFMDGTKATNFITVGASSDGLNKGKLAADFSNYSKQYVDIFAPGVKIYSTATNNTYEAADGTSLASPVVSGVAALLKSYFPKLTPENIIEIITKSGTTINEEVLLPGEGNKKTPFSQLCVSGKIINAFNAVKLVLDWEAKGKL